MIRISVVILAALLSCSLPAVVSADGFLPCMPSLSGWSCAPAHKANCSVAGKLGYLGYNRGAIFGIEALGTPLLVDTFLRDAVRMQFPVEGLWLGASVTCCGPERGFSGCDPDEPLCLSLGATWLDPNNKPGTAEQSFRPLVIDGGDDDPIVERDWSTNLQWYTLEASASRRLGNFSLIGGFRYDSFAVKLSKLASDAELQLTSYIPYVGGVTRWGAVQVEVIGFPWVPGTFQYKESFEIRQQRLEALGNYRNAYFMEMTLDIGGQIRAVHLSGFATYTVLHAVGELDASVSRGRGVVPRGSPFTAPCNFSFDRQNWIVGGKAVIGFNSPL